ncbi:MAG: cation-translocating P-type ATPase, partial [Polyangiaceae bacterium]|nr:cation-translocating P-type ATPase [Polyangiaceae bacterium]
MAEELNLDDPSLRDADEVARILGTEVERGLSSDEAARRLAAGGPNELRVAAQTPAWRKLLAEFDDPLIYLLLVAVIVSTVVWWMQGRVGWPVDSAVIGLIVIGNALLGYAQTARAENAVAALRRMSAVTSAVIRDGVVVRVPSAELVRGDLLSLGEGDAVGADARLIRTAALRVQEASLTGESEAVLKDAAVLGAPAALADRFNMVYKATAVTQGTGLAVVTAIGMDTQMGS